MWSKHIYVRWLIEKEKLDIVKSQFSLSTL